MDSTLNIGNGHESLPQGGDGVGQKSVMEMLDIDELVQCIEEMRDRMTSRNANGCGSRRRSRLVAEMDRLLDDDEYRIDFPFDFARRVGEFVNWNIEEIEEIERDCVSVSVR